MAAADFDVAYHWTRTSASGATTGWTTIGNAFRENDGRINVRMNAAPLPGIQTNPGSFTLFPKTDPKKKADKETPPEG